MSLIAGDHHQEGYFLKSDEKHYWIHHAYRYGREGCVDQIALRRIPKTLDKEDIIKQLAETYHHRACLHDYIYYQKRLSTWEEDRSMLERFSGDLVAYEREFKKPQEPVVPASYVEAISKFF